MADDARTGTVVIGGGVLGASTAYHLAMAGEPTVLLEAHDLGDGTTFHSAGMVGQLRSRRSIGELITHSAQLYAQLERAHPGALGFTARGSVRLASTDLRLAEFEAQIELLRMRGVPAEIVGVDRLSELSPLLRPDGVIGACWIPSDGQADAVQLARGLAALAAGVGAEICTGARVMAIESVSGGYLIHVDGRRIRADNLVLAAGVHTTVLAAMLGMVVPMLASKQQAIISHPLPLPQRDFPTLREPDRDLIMRAADGRLLVGSYAKDPEIVPGAHVPLAPRVGFDGEWERMRPAWDAAIERVPILAEVGWDRVIKAADAATADTELILGESGMPGLWLATGGNGHGVAAAGGAGWFVARAVIDGVPPIDGADFRLDRFDPRLRDDPDALVAATRRAEAGHYALSEVQA
jgi:glycine/D-amino acid oxidase-like deaminating enzyme